LDELTRFSVNLTQTVDDFLADRTFSHSTRPVSLSCMSHSPAVCFRPTDEGHCVAKITMTSLRLVRVSTKAQMAAFTFVKF